jgi:hypothetical protein
MPCVVEGDELSVALVAGLILEDDVVVTVRVEGRVEVDQVDGLFGDVSAPKDVQVVAVVEDVRLQSLLPAPSA